MVCFQPLSLSNLQYRGAGILVSAIYHDTNEEYDQNCYLILVRRESEWIVALYADGDWDWSSARYFVSVSAAMSYLLRAAAERWDIDWSAAWGLAK